MKQEKKTIEVLKQAISNQTSTKAMSTTQTSSGTVNIANKNLKAPQKPQKPNWAKLKNGYPIQGTSDDIFTYVFGNNNRGWVNTCATRVSIALLKADANITGGWYVNKLSQLHKDLNLKKGVLKRVIINIHEMKKWLTNTYGGPTYTIKPSSQNDYVTIDDVKAKISGKTGIMLMEGIHITLWDKNNGIRGEWDYYDCPNVYFWEI